MINYSYDTLTSKEIRIEIGKRLHEERVRADLSLDKLAELTGYSKPTVQRWEKGWKNGTGENIVPTLDQIIDLCSIYNCSPGYLLCEYDERTRQACDISKEIGLSEKSIDTLQYYFQALLTNENNGGSAKTILSFINYFIENIGALDMVLFNRHLLAHKQDRLKNHPEKQQIIEGYNTIISEVPNTDKINNELYAQSELRKELESKLWDYYLSEKFDSYTQAEKEHYVSETFRYLDVLTSHKLKQINFEFSETYLSMVDDFFTDYLIRLETYHAFILRQKNKISNLENDIDG